jgi:hypothetical protein
LFQTGGGLGVFNEIACGQHVVIRARLQRQEFAVQQTCACNHRGGVARQFDIVVDGQADFGLIAFGVKAETQNAADFDAADFHGTAIFKPVDFAEAGFQFIPVLAAQLCSGVKEKRKARSDQKYHSAHGGFDNVSFHFISPSYITLRLVPLHVTGGVFFYLFRRLPCAVIGGAGGALSAHQGMARRTVSIVRTRLVGQMRFLPCTAMFVIGRRQGVCLVVQPAMPFGGNQRCFRFVFINDPAAFAFGAFARLAAVIHIAQIVFTDLGALEQGVDQDLYVGQNAKYGNFCHETLAMPESGGFYCPPICGITPKAQCFSVI